MKDSYSMVRISAAVIPNARHAKPSAVIAYLVAGAVLVCSTGCDSTNKREAIRGVYAMPITILFPARMERLGRFFQQWHCIKDIYAMPLYRAATTIGTKTRAKVVLT